MYKTAVSQPPYTANGNLTVLAYLRLLEAIAGENASLNHGHRAIIPPYSESTKYRERFNCLLVYPQGMESPRACCNGPCDHSRRNIRIKTSQALLTGRPETCVETRTNNRRAHSARAL